MSRDYPTLDEQYGPGAEQADAEAQDDVAAELQEAIDSRSYDHAAAVLAELKRDWEASQCDAEARQIP